MKLKIPSLGKKNLWTWVAIGVVGLVAYGVISNRKFGYQPLDEFVDETQKYAGIPSGVNIPGFPNYPEASTGDGTTSGQEIAQSAAAGPIRPLGYIENRITVA